MVNNLFISYNGSSGLFREMFSEGARWNWLTTLAIGGVLQEMEAGLMPMSTRHGVSARPLHSNVSRPECLGDGAVDLFRAAAEHREL